MKIALLGTGKTGSKVIEAHGQEYVTSFNSANPPTLEALRQHDVIIAFLAGPVFMQYLEILLKSGLPLANGSTGLAWPDDIDQRLQAQGTAWVTAGNFSLGMNLIHGMIKVLSQAPKLFDNYHYNLHEIHHIHKLDRPSGTALAWQDWLGQESTITSERVGEVIGDHKLTLVTPYEDISLEHHAKDRRIYAEGALWTARKLVKGDIKPGLHELQTIMEQELGL